MYEYILCVVCECIYVCDLCAALFVCDVYTVCVYVYACVLVGIPAYGGQRQTSLSLLEVCYLYFFKVGTPTEASAHGFG